MNQSSSAPGSGDASAGDQIDPSCPLDAKGPFRLRFGLLLLIGLCMFVPHWALVATSWVGTFALTYPGWKVPFTETVWRGNRPWESFNCWIAGMTLASAFPPAAVVLLGSSWGVAKNMQPKVDGGGS